MLAGIAKLAKKNQAVPKILEELSPEQLAALYEKLEKIKKLEQDLIELKASKLGTTKKGFNVETATFHNSDDWVLWSDTPIQTFKAPRLSWEILRKSVGEGIRCIFDKNHATQDKYQSKKNWSSTKGKGVRKDPMAKRLNLYDLKLFGVNPLDQYPFLVVCDSCGISVNAPFLKFHQEIDCKVSAPKKDDRRSLVGRIKDRTDSSFLKRSHSDISKNDSSFANSKNSSSSRSSKKSKLKQDVLSLEKDNNAGSSKSDDKEGSKSKRTSKSATNSKSASKSKVVEFDLDKQCGVIAPPSNKQCTRSLTCKAHSMAMKRAVRGRSQPFDTLLQAHLAKSRSAKHTRANDHSSAVRRAAAMAIGDNASNLLNALLDDALDSEEHDTESETENFVNMVASYVTKPLATKINYMPRKRQHYLRIHDLFFDALKPSGVQCDNNSKIGANGLGLEIGVSCNLDNSSMSSSSNAPFTSVASVATVHSNPSIAAMMSTLRMAVGNRNPAGNRVSATSLTQNHGNSQ
ncbi:hypothetical protein BB561_001688 [Smittium simulii]|uniref:SCA7 domain-containing protein n=1 Tax=Smittium simulii TaxID=133385 RepID=A0A2T9YTG7_9FUNG|nr:hypothetical protein BB561_001688 [Smittium simulii]